MGAKSLYVGGGGGLDRQRVAFVEESGVGSIGHSGKFSSALGDKSLAAAGVMMPPLHGRCRSMCLPSLSSSGAARPASTLGWFEPDLHQGKPQPLFVNPTPGPSATDAKAAAIEALHALPPSGFDDGTVQMWSTSLNDYSYISYDDMPGMSSEQFKEVLEKHGTISKKPKFDLLHFGDNNVNVKEVEELIKSPKKLAEETKQIRIVKYNGEYRCVGGDNAVAAHKLLGKNSVAVHYTDIDKIPKHELPQAHPPAPVPLPKPPHVEGPKTGHVPAGFAPTRLSRERRSRLRRRHGEEDRRREGKQRRRLLPRHRRRETLRQVLFGHVASRGRRHLANSLYRDAIADGAAKSTVFLHELERFS